MFVVIEMSNVVDEELKDGFLDEKMNKNRQYIKQEYRTEFDLLYQFNRFSYKVLDNYNKNDIKVTEANSYILVSFSEIGKNYQAAIIMVEMGLMTNFEAILRNMLELSIKIKYVLNDNKNINKLKKNSCFEMLRKIQYIKSNKLFDIIPKNVLDEKENELKNIYQTYESVKQLPNMHDICRSLKLYNEYAIYKYLCNYTHYDYCTMNNLVNYTNEGVYINANVNFDEVRTSCLRLLSILEIAMSDMIYNFFPNLETEFVLLINKFYNLRDSYSDEDL